MTWTPNDALVEKAARAACVAVCPDAPRGRACKNCERHREWAAYADHVRAALFAARDDMVAEAVKADAELDEAFRDVTASLVAAVSLLRGGGKKAAPSDKMFAIMLDDYEKSIEAARSILRARHP